ncbi:hypothetical protein [Agrobacterium pusense]|nr:hypothetical protein [Agrobacterium pusense]WCK24142.1 hypothetical protein CFBP5496_0000630 [Agrobacterium pusense]
MTREQRKRLPKAGLIRFEWSSYSYIAKFRLANAMKVQIGRLSIVWRMPWLEHSARRLHPEVFG